MSATFTGPAGTTTDHERKVTLKLRKHIRASGNVTVTDGFVACAANVPVQIWFYGKSSDRLVKETTTKANGKYSVKIKDKKGRYYAYAPVADVDPSNACLPAFTKRLIKHKH